MAILCWFFKTNPGSNISRNSSFTATYLPSLKPSKYDEQDMWDTAGENNSLMTFFYGSLQMDVLGLADQQELI